MILNSRQFFPFTCSIIILRLTVCVQNNNNYSWQRTVSQINHKSHTHKHTEPTTFFLFFVTVRWSQNHSSLAAARGFVLSPAGELLGVSGVSGMELRTHPFVAVHIAAIDYGGRAEKKTTIHSSLPSEEDGRGRFETTPKPEHFLSVEENVDETKPSANRAVEPVGQGLCGGMILFMRRNKKSPCWCRRRPGK